MVNLPEHKRPSPANPSLQVQLCPPTVLVQLAFTSQLWLPVLHSSISTTEIILWTQYVYKSRLAWGLQVSVPPLTLVSQQIYVNTSGHLQQILLRHIHATVLVSSDAFIDILMMFKRLKTRLCNLWCVMIRSSMHFR